MKVFSAIFLPMISWVTFHIIFLSAKQNLGHALLLRPHTLGKLILLTIGLGIKQNLGHAWLFGPHTFGKLIPLVILLGVKQNLGYAWSIGPPTLGKLALPNI